jgi:hypothetical protein
MRKLFENWRSYTESVDLELTLLVEGRLQDTMKKFPDIPEYIIKQLSASDPSEKNAYLMWMARAMKDAGSAVYSVAGPAGEYVFDLVPVVTAFHNSKQRISQLNKARKGRGESLLPNDISQFKSLQQLEDFLDDLGFSSSIKKKKEKEEALGGASILQDDEDFFILRPETQEASCFFGKKTKWCISATQSQNYYDSYTRQGKSFYFILNKNLNDDSKYRKIALVYEKGGEFDEFFDVEDEGYNDSYELERILLYNLIAPAIKKSGYELNDRYLDLIAGALLDGESMEDMVQKTGYWQAFKSIIKYLKDKGDIAFLVDDIPDPGDDFVPTDDYSYEDAALGFIELSQQTWYSIHAEASQDTMDNPPGRFDSEQLRQMVEDAELDHINVTYDEDYEDEWQWEGSVTVQLDDAPFDQLRYEVESPEGEKYITDDFEEAYGKYDDREMVRDLIQSAFDSSGMYIDDIQDDDSYVFYMRMTPDHSEDPRNGLDGFSEFLDRMRLYDKHYEEAIEKTFQDLVDDGIAIDPRNELEDGGKESLKSVLMNLKHFGYDLKGGNLNIFTKVVFNIPDMMKNFREMQKFFPALPLGKLSTVRKSDDERRIIDRQVSLVYQLEKKMSDSFRFRPEVSKLFRKIEDTATGGGPAVRARLKQQDLPGLGKPLDVGPRSTGFQDAEIKRAMGVDFFRSVAVFTPRLKLIDSMPDAQKDDSEMAIGDREIVGAHGVGSFGFQGIPLKSLRSSREQEPEGYRAYIAGLKWLDENYQELQEIIGQYISDNLVDAARRVKNDPEFADLRDEEIARRSREVRPRSGVAEGGCPAPKRKRKIRIKIR